MTGILQTQIIDGTQFTIGWYVDGNKLSHDNPDILMKVIEKIETKFRKISVTRGKKHYFLGMKITFNDNSKKQHQMKQLLPI